ncbi:FAD-binding type 2 [Penicillium robsamsonii]|uniref:FAD-binding type 2 n=1 Tax=Penicillium robsamsonii TaxID=1792511 RepID=UPI0025484179|nr:FAD-binding type 2 [Penicillium robsamsonii]KAJ5817880.1 FAD-binding type 2 [Penicillium robsamsonii]
MHITPTVAALCVGALSKAAHATTSQNCCSELEATALKSQVTYPNSAAYKTSIDSYWAENVKLEPTCVVQPRTAKEVSLAVSTLVASDAGSCKFAVRGGGHTTWAGASNIADGVTIDLSLMNTTTYNEKAGIASILPGSRWGAVYDTLAKYNVTVPGGRSNVVGVAGFLLGGGNTFHTSRVGFACDNVENYEVVLADGTIIEANRNSHADLFKALKGGSGNFGIVTKYDMKVIEGDKLWGGLVTYDNSTSLKHLEAGHEFINNLGKDHYASWIGMWEYLSVTDQNMIANALEYTIPVAYPPAFDSFTSIANTSSSMRVTNLWNLTEEIVQAYGYRDVFVTATFVNNLDVMKKTIEIHNRMIEEARGSTKGDDYTMFTMIQPWPKLFTDHSIKQGGNMLGLDRFDENLFQVLIDYSWKNEADDDLFNRLANSALEELVNYSKSIGANNEFIYLNYANSNQDPLSNYGRENVEYMRTVAKKYDQAGVFQTQVPGGFKISAVGQ